MAYIKAHICNEDFNAALKQYKTFRKSEKSSKHYTPITIWINSELNKFNQDVSISLDFEENAPNKPEKAVYIGNGITETGIKELQDKKQKSSDRLNNLKQEVKQEVKQENATEDVAYAVVVNDDLPF